MPVVSLQTRIHAPAARVFDLSRDIDLHRDSMAHAHERAVAGVTRGMIGANETVTWKARHLGVTWRLTSKVTQFDPPYSFTDEMQDGPFRKMVHRHIFETHGDETMMTDEFEFESPLGSIGRIADRLFLFRYLERLLRRRNVVLKYAAENA